MICGPLKVICGTVLALYRVMCGLLQVICGLGRPIQSDVRSCQGDVRYSYAHKFVMCGDVRFSGTPLGFSGEGTAPFPHGPSIIAVGVFFPPNSIALQADYVTVVEDRPIMSVKYRLLVPIFDFWPKLTHPAARSLCDN